MTRKIVTILLTAATILFSACQKDLDVFVPDKGQMDGPDTTWYSTVTDVMPVAALRNSLLLDTYSDSIDVSSKDTVTTASGMECIFPANCCVNAAGQPVTGKINVDVVFLNKKGDMVRMNRPTTSYSRLLVSGGEIFVRMRKENKDLFLAPAAKIEMKFADLFPNSAMNFYAGVESTVNNLNWIDNPDIANNSVAVGSQGYEINTNRLRWVNCAYLFDTAAITRSVVTTNLPSSYTNANTSVYIVFNDMQSVVSLASDVASKKFTSSKLPDGKTATMVVLSKQGNDYFFGKQSITIGGTGGQQIVTVIPTISSLTAIKSFLNTL
jgi:hypothetical protein